MNKRLKILFSALSLLAILTLSFSAFASSYTSTLYFKDSFSGSTRYFDGRNITFEATTDCQSEQTSSVYTVSLYRDNPWWKADDFIGKVEFPRNGYKSTTWYNVGSGNYYFKFSKYNDNYYVHSNDVKMHN